MIFSHKTKRTFYVFLPRQTCVHLTQILTDVIKLVKLVQYCGDGQGVVGDLYDKDKGLCF